MGETATASTPASSSSVAGEAERADADALRTQAVELLDTAVAAMNGQRRDGQHEMVRRVMDAIDGGEHLLVQAGTGTGKSLAYLIPLIVHALNHDKPSVVATATLALQAQIVGRDVPRLLAALEPLLPRPIDVVLVKGRSNYVCQHKVGGGFPSEDASEGALFSLGEDTSVMHLPGAKAGPSSPLGKEVVRLREWAQETETGDRDELTPGVTDKAWRQVSVTSMECLGAQRCPLAEVCFSELARAKGGQADIVVTNHAMLAISAFEGIAVLPDYDVVVVDEAHELQDRVTGAVTGQLSLQMVQAAASSTRKHTGVSVEALHSSAAALDLAFADTATGLLPNGLNEEHTAAVEQLRDAARVALSDSKPEGSASADGGRSIARARLNLIFDLCERLLSAKDSREVVWASRTGTFTPGQGYQKADDGEPPVINIAPLSVAGKLREGLFADHTVVLTSATLAIGESFQATAGGLGLLGAGAPAWSGTDVGSPFDYPKQGMLYVAAHLAKPGFGTSPQQLSELEALITAAGGGTLALFSSRRAAEDAAQTLRKKLKVKILCQGDSSMAGLITEFAQEPDTCLFGTMSLWQGVDVQGASCRLVVIDRIPFPRPDDPLVTARARAVSQNGGDGFIAISATHAAIRLAQGVGRLIRSSSDRGVVAVLDSRLANASYGGFLRAALPPFWSTKDRTVALSALKRLSGK